MRHSTIHRTFPRSRRAMVVAIAASAMVALLTGCQTRMIESPTVTVRQVRLVEQTPEGARVEVTVELKNPNGVPLPLTSSIYHLQVAGASSSSMSDYPSKTLPSRGTQTIVLPAAFKLDKTILNGADYKVDGTISYEPPGELQKMFAESGIPRPKVSFEGSGKLE